MSKLTHNFWNNMPIDFNKDDFNKEIVKLTKNKTYTDKPIILPGKLYWYNINLETDSDIIVDFLNSNYHENNSSIKFIFNKELLNWLINYDSRNKRLSIGVKFKNKIVGCIFGLIRNLNLNNKKIQGVETNLLCLDKKIRNLKIAPLMIQELTRRVNYDLKINQSIYTTNLELPNKLSSTNYLYRFINVRKMIDLGFISKDLETDLGYDKIVDYYHNMKGKIKGKVLLIDQLSQDQIIKCMNLLNNFITKSKLGYYFDENLFRHTFINKSTKTWIILNKNKITDMVSCYFQDSMVDSSNNIKNCNLYYYFNNFNKLEHLVNIVIKYSINKNIDRIKVLNILDYNLLDNYNFDLGCTNINFYIYNWYSKNILKKYISYFVF